METLTSIAQIIFLASALYTLHLVYKPRIIPIRIICRNCTAPLTTKTMSDHKCITRRIEDL